MTMPDRVLVTGATGFVGSHTVVALLDRGHRVRVLARTPDKVPRVLEPLGVDPADVEVAPGGMTDAVAVRDALAGCDAVLHAAAQVDFAPGGADHDANVVGTRTVVGEAVHGGIDHVVYTSTIGAYVPTEHETLTPQSRLAEPTTAYGRSKRDAEELVRTWQADGAPITTVVLGSVYGPTSPHLDGSFLALRGALETMMIELPGGLGVIDVRDVAALLAEVVGHGTGPSRHMAGGRFVTWADWSTYLSRAVGREIPSQPMALDEIVAMGGQLDRRRAAGETIDVPLSEEAALAMGEGVPTDDRRTLQVFGLEYRDVVTTLRDQVRWMVASGHLDPDLAPAVADAVA